MRAWSVRTDAALSPNAPIAGSGSARSKDASNIRAPDPKSIPTNLKMFMEYALHASFIER